MSEAVSEVGAAAPDSPMEAVVARSTREREADVSGGVSTPLVDMPGRIEGVEAELVKDCTSSNPVRSAARSGGKTGDIRGNSLEKGGAAGGSAPRNAISIDSAFQESTCRDDFFWLFVFSSPMLKRAELSPVTPNRQYPGVERRVRGGVAR